MVSSQRNRPRLSIPILFFFLLLSNLLFAKNDFVKSQIRQAELKLYFTSDIERVTYFSIPGKEGVTKYVYDIYGATLPDGKGISQHTFRTVESFKMGQNSPERLRVVIQSKQKALDRHAYQGKVLAIPLVHGQKATIEGVTLANADKKTKFKSTDSPINRYIVVIDAGHGGKDSGALGGQDRIEKTVVFSISKKLKTKLESMGFQVYMTRSQDSFVELPKRTEYANEKRADIFISIHANAAPNKAQENIFKGLEIYYLSPAQTQRAKDAAEKENSVMFQDKDYYTKNAYLSLLNREKIVESHKLGLDVDHEIVSSVQSHYGHLEDGGVKPANFWVLVGAQMPAILVETGYITHPQEGKNLLDSYYQKLVAKGIAEGIERYLKNKR